MPCCRALRSTVEMPALFSTATAIASTCRVIQFSTNSFCFAASRLVGPSQIRSTPSSLAASSAPARALTKYGSPFAFGIIAITGRRVEEDVAAAGPCPNECTSQTLVPATMSAPASTAAHRIATWLFFTRLPVSKAWPSSSSVTSERRRKRSILMVATSNTPVSTPVNSEGSAARCKPFWRTDKANSPNIAPQIVPRPPNTDVPPSTTAVIASSS